MVFNLRTISDVPLGEGFTSNKNPELCTMNALPVLSLNELEDRIPAHALVAGIDLVVIRYDDEVSVLYGRCAHRGALMADGHVDGDNLICGLHGWDYRLDTGVSEYNNTEALQKFKAWIEDGQVCVDGDEIGAWAKAHPQPYKRDAYQGAYQDPTGTSDEPMSSSSASSPTRA